MGRRKHRGDRKVKGERERMEEEEDEEEEGKNAYRVEIF